jgi:hypothetical protein
VTGFEIRRRANVIGMVTDGVTKKPFAGAEVALEIQGRVLRARSRPDGLFSFPDIPPGTWTISARWPEGVGRYGEWSASIKVTAPAGAKLVPSRVAVVLPPTAVGGRVMDSEGAGIPLALVKMRGSFDSAYTDREGKFRIAGIEPGKRELLVTARGFQPSARKVEFSTGEQKDLEDLRLEPVAKRGE